MSEIKCGNCDNEVSTCDRDGCKNTFKGGSGIYCEDYGDKHFCSEDCLLEEHEVSIETCVEIEEE